MNANQIAAGRLRYALMLWGVLLALAPVARAQERIGVNIPFLVKDINTTASQRLSSNPRNYTVIGSVVYFAADDPAWGAELWRSDGTAAGTYMVKDINPGAGSSNPRGLANVGGTLYFAADNGLHGAEPWKSDGTAAGTRMVKDLFPGKGASMLDGSQFVLFNGKVYFTAAGVFWKSDGSEAGTTRILSSNSLPIAAQPSSLRILNGKLYFLSIDNLGVSTNGSSLWRCDGTAAGTAQIGSLGVATVSTLESLNGSLYIVTGNSAGKHLWKSDGTPAGTRLLKDFPNNPLVIYTCLSPLANLNGQLFFLAARIVNTAPGTRELWKSDGTPAGTVLVKSFPMTQNLDAADGPVNFNGALYLAAEDGTRGMELWRSDGTLGGTRQVRDINPGPAGSFPKNLMLVNGRLWFAATDGTHGRQLWQSDGSAAGTTLVTTANGLDPYFSNSPSAPPVTPNGTLFFGASDPVHGTEVWATRGTPASTALVRDLAIGSDSGINRMTAAADTLYFAANDSVHGQELWKSNVTPASTVLVKDIRPGRAGSLEPVATMHFDDSSTFVNSRMLYAYGTAWLLATGPSGTQGLWKSNRTAAGTLVVKDGFTEIYAMAASSGRIFLLARDATHGVALWITNTAGTGATLLREYGALTLNLPQSMANANGMIFFSITGSGREAGLWKSNGTPGGTVQLSTVVPEGRLVAAGSRVFYPAQYGALEQELWVSDGTAAGTKMVKDIYVGIGGSSIEQLTPLRNIVYFTAIDYLNDTNSTAHGRELWRSDGTEAGTYLVKDIMPTRWGGSNPQNLTVVGNTLYFSADDGVHGPELWKSNGTAAGTVLVKDITPGAYGSNPTSLANVYGTLYFNAYHPTFGNELWTSNGTAAGTWIASDLITGAKGSNPTNLTLVGNFLYFAAANYNTPQGRELWAVRVR